MQISDYVLTDYSHFISRGNISNLIDCEKFGLILKERILIGVVKGVL